jgi:DNA-binding NarL/FixJ family response regulator
MDVDPLWSKTFTESLSSALWIWGYRTVTESTRVQFLRNRKTSHIPIIALTGWMSELWREKASRLGIETYLLKPASPQTLKQTIEEFTANRLPEEML